MLWLLCVLLISSMRPEERSIVSSPAATKPPSASYRL
jgi:hypothetical protein